jgi:hypothetical protein
MMFPLFPAVKSGEKIPAVTETSSNRTIRIAPSGSVAERHYRLPTGENPSFFAALSVAGRQPVRKIGIMSGTRIRFLDLVD